MSSLSQDDYDDLFNTLKSTKETAEPGIHVDREAELVLQSLYKDRSARTVRCVNCKQTFQTNYKYQGICSRKCLKEQLSVRGLEWDPDKSEEERWKGQPPSTITPTTLKQLYGWAKSIVIEYEKLDPIEPTQLAEHVEVEKEYFDPDLAMFGL